MQWVESFATHRVHSFVTLVLVNVAAHALVSVSVRLVAHLAQVFPAMRACHNGK